MRKLIYGLSVCLLAMNPIGGAAQEIPIQVPDGFEVTHFATDDLATNIYAMTINGDGNVVVAGPGYIKTLLDTDGDGRADKVQNYSSKPAQGAQGLFFEGDYLYATGDGGLLRFEDKNRDGVADGDPEKILNIKTGGEHDAHAMRRGPDGWLYLLCGNGVPIKKEYWDGKDSPVKKPRAGFLMRFSPDFKTREIYCHGFRNAYDFDFDMLGDVYVYDSDGERDVSMPWYRPTRVFRMLPGDDAGFVSPSWKRPDYFSNMPTVAAKLGRGSPTGVVCYRHRQFPDKYFNSIFVLDWTFGRIVSVHQNEKGEYRNELFASGKNTFGFAPTDIEVAPDGSIFVSVGGRGTRGGVYRFQYKKNAGLKPRPGALPDQPLSSWAAKQVSRVDGLNAEQLFQVYLDPERHRGERVLAIQKWGELIGTKVGEFDFGNVANDKEDLWLQSALVSSVGKHVRKRDTKNLRDYLRKMGDNPSFLIRDAVFRHQLKLGLDDDDAIEKWPIEFVWGTDKRQKRLNVFSDFELFHLTRKPSRPVFSSYEGGAGSGAGEETSSDREMAQYVVKELIFEENVDFSEENIRDRYELARFGAAVEGSLGEKEKSAYSKRLLSLIDPANSDPVDDIHFLICHSVMAPQANKEDREKVAKTLVRIVPKIVERNYARDRNWPRHMRDVVERLIKNDPKLRDELIAQKDFAIPENEYLFFVAGGDERKKLSERLFARLKANPNAESIDARLISFIGEPVVRDRDILDSLWAREELRPALINLASRKPDLSMLDQFVEGLANPDPQVARRSATALIKLKPKTDPRVVAWATRNLARLGWDKKDHPIRNQMVFLLRQQTGEELGFDTSPKGQTEQSTAVSAWRNYTKSEFPEAYAKAFANENVAVWTNEMLVKVKWEAGDLERGRKLYRALSCAKCHDGARAVGPSLKGITRRFGKADLFKTITQPDDQVSSRYKTLVIETTDGEIHKGVVIYESVDGLTMLNDESQTIRIENSEIDFRQWSTTSLMPAGLLDKAKPEDWADLYEYLKTLK